MKINWKLRLKNKTTLSALIACMVAFIYQILGILGVVPAISEEQTAQFFGVMLNILVGLGVLVDPTTAGTNDSQQALTYNRPN